MKRSGIRWIAAVAFVLLVAVTVIGTRGRGLSTRRSPFTGEERLARFVRGWTLPSAYRTMSNPIAATPEAVRAGMEHWADHCAICHGNDGSGRVTIGRGLFPRSPDMRKEATQLLSDGALFYAIEEGVPFTGMPAWSMGMEEGRRQSWELVLFIRHLPQITSREIDDMEKLNPKSPADMEQEHRIREFLKGGSK